MTKAERIKEFNEKYLDDAICTESITLGNKRLLINGDFWPEDLSMLIQALTEAKQIMEMDDE